VVPESMIDMGEFKEVEKLKVEPPKEKELIYNNIF
jgi:hypothetical protein